MAAGAGFSSKLEQKVAVRLVLPLVLGLMLSVGLSIGLLWSAVPKWLSICKTKSEEIQESTVEQIATARALFAKEVVQRAANNLHIHTDFTANLLTGVYVAPGTLSRNDTLTMFEGASGFVRTACGTGYTEECSYASDNPEWVCECRWDDSQKTCSYSNDDTYDRTTRGSQHPSWFVQIDNNDASTGDRSESSYPSCCAELEWDDFGQYSGDTDWYGSVAELPGRGYVEDDDYSSSPYATAYDRVRTYALLAASSMPLYNHYTESDRTVHAYIGNAQDGGLQGWYGCNANNGWADKWQATSKSDFDETCDSWSNPNDGPVYGGTALCPEGKIGYDARCRNWYSEAEDAVDGVYLTPPYEFASNPPVMGTTMCITLRDSDAETISMSVIDFSVDVIEDAIVDTTILDHGFGFMITPQLVSGSDTVVMCPNSDECFDPLADCPDVRPIEEWISKDSTFNALRDKMKAGETGSGKYKKGGETWFLAFAPVDPSVRARYSGDATSSYAADLLTYSVGITVPVKDIERPFDEIEESIDGALTGLLVFYFVALSLIILCILCVSHSIVGTLSRPILTLLSLVKRVNRKELDGDLPDMAGGSVEVSAIYGVFKQLYTVIRFSNDAFFAGDPKLAHEVMSEALKLFESLNNARAIAIANNNLGNISFSQYRVGMAKLAKENGTRSPRPNAELAAQATAAIEHYCEAVTQAHDALQTHRGTGGPAGSAQVVGQVVARTGVSAAAEAELLPGVELTTQNSHSETEMQLVTQFARRMFSLAVCVAETNTPLGAKETPVCLDSLVRRLNLAGATSGFSLIEHALSLARPEGKTTVAQAVALGKLLENAKEPDALAQASRCLAAVISVYDSQLHAPNFPPKLALQIEITRCALLIVQGNPKLSLTRAVTLLEASPMLDVGLQVNALKAVCGAADQVPQAAAVAQQARADIADIAALSALKYVVMAVDISGSMTGTRIETAKMNALKVYDEHINDIDHMAFIVFGSNSKEVFPLQLVGERRQALRTEMDNSMTIKGLTAFYDAVMDCANNISKAPEAAKSYVIMLTDGEDTASRSNYKKAFCAMKNAPGSPNLIIIGIDLSASLQRKMGQLCSVTKDSVFIDASGGVDAINESFAKVAEMISGGDGLVMESM